MNTSESELSEIDLNYESLDISLVDAKAMVGAAEAHGLVCGFICAGSKMDGKAWIDSVIGILEPAEQGALDCRGMLVELYDFSSRQLKEMSFNFRLLLPEDEEDLYSRAEAVGYWCQGYMTGLGLAGIEIEHAHSEDVRDALFHFSEIAKIDYDNLDISEDDEVAYTEVYEYVRMAVLMIYAEFAGVKEGGARQQAQKDLH